LFLATLVLSTWREARRFVFTIDDDCLGDLRAFDAVILMDGFVTKERVERIAGVTRLYVLAWNGLFEIRRYRDQLGARSDVVYAGTDDSLPDGVLPPTSSYLPTIDPACGYVEWKRRFERKDTFEVRGNASYRSHWLRTRLATNRWGRLLVSTTGALIDRPRTARRTFESAFVTNKLVWAGNCHLDMSSFELPAHMTELVDEQVATIRRTSSTDDRLRAGLRLVERWRGTARTSLEPSRANEEIYVANTLLRWTVLDFLISTDKRATWFFGQDNFGLGLEFELYVYNLVPTRRIAFVDFGGKTSATALYPRSLVLLGRRSYVIPVLLPEPGESYDGVLATIDKIRVGLGRRDSFFGELEQRRELLYAELPGDCSLAELQRRVWSDFLRAT
jgi:Arc/MetJ-type ribon-helix-helix transcriptional regulator